MKNWKSLAFAILAFVSFTTNAQTNKISTSKSTIKWTGKKVVGSHEGNISFKDGSLTFKNKVLTGGSFNVDMTTITCTDLKAGEGKESLEGHLKADDFFGTEKHKTSTLVFKTVKSKGKGVYTVTADLTIKGVKNAITFDLSVNGKTATTTLKVDRTKYGIKYGSGSFFDGLGDKAISDEFELKINLAW
jgi:polyisoprenoid-binding protein YceI